MRLGHLPEVPEANDGVFRSHCCRTQRVTSDRPLPLSEPRVLLYDSGVGGIGLDELCRMKNLEGASPMG